MMTEQIRFCILMAILSLIFLEKLKSHIPAPKFLEKILLNTVKPRFWNTFTLKILFKKRFFAADQNF